VKNTEHLVTISTSPGTTVSFDLADVDGRPTLVLTEETGGKQTAEILVPMSQAHFIGVGVGKGQFLLANRACTSHANTSPLPKEEKTRNSPQTGQTTPETA
jgi:hypothetical protein